MNKKILAAFMSVALALSVCGGVFASSSDGVSYESEPQKNNFVKAKTIDLEPGWEIVYHNFELFPDEYDDEGNFLSDQVPELPLEDPDGWKVPIVGRVDNSEFIHSHVILRHVDGETGETSYKVLNINDMTLYGGGKMLSLACYIEGIDSIAISLGDDQYGILQGDGTLLNDTGWNYLVRGFIDGAYLVGITVGNDGEYDFVEWTYLDETGRKIAGDFPNAYYFSEGFAAVELQNGDCTYIKNDGTFMNSNVWKDTFDFYGGFGEVQLENGNWTFIKPDGTLLNETGFKTTHRFSGGFGLAQLSGDRYTFIRPDGTYLNNTGWKAVRSFVNGFGTVTLDNGNKTFIRPDGTLISETGWKDVYDFSEGFALVIKENDRRTFVKPDGTYISDADWEHAYHFKNGFGCVYLDGGNGTFIRPDGTLINDTGWAGGVGQFWGNGYAPVYDADGNGYYVDFSGKTSLEKCLFISDDSISDYLYLYLLSETDSEYLKIRLFDPKTNRYLISEDTVSDNLLQQGFCFSLFLLENGGFRAAQFILKNTDSELKSFSAGGKSAVISGTNITLTLPAGTDLSKLIPDILLPYGASIDKSGTQNFSGQVTYTVTAEDGVTQSTYNVNVNLEKNDESKQPDSSSDNQYPAAGSEAPLLLMAALALSAGAAACMAKKRKRL